MNQYQTLTQMTNNVYSYQLEIIRSIMSKAYNKDKEIDWSRIFDEYNLVGGRYAGKTYSVASLIALLMLATYNTDIKIAVYALRLMSVDTQELRKEIDNALRRFGMVENANKFKFIDGNYIMKKGSNYIFPNGSYIQLKGVYVSNSNKTSFKGLGAADNYDLQIRWFEEANEVSKAEFQAVDMAVRGAKKVIRINTSNPDSIFQYYINYVDNISKFNKLELLTKGEQLFATEIKNIDVRTNSETSKRIVNHYTNWQVNAHNMTQDAISEMLELQRLDPVKYEIWGIGMPGGLETAIFSRYMKDIHTENYEPIHFYAGIDLGQADSPTGHPTTAQLVSWDGKHNLIPEAEYFHSNALMPHKNPNTIAYEIVEFFIRQAHRFPQLRAGLTAYIDFGAGGGYMYNIIQEIREKEYPMENWLNFDLVDKSVWKTKDRIDATIALMVSNKLKIDRQKTPWLFEQMSIMEWKKPSNNSRSYKLEMLDLNDDTWDALCYAIMPILENVGNIIENRFLMKTNRKVVDYNA